jgi:hypothetical protein
MCSHPRPPPDFEIIIRKNAEPGRNYSTMSDGNRWAGYSKVRTTKKREGMWFRTRRYRQGDVLTGEPQE